MIVEIVWSVYLVCLVCLVSMVSLVCLAPVEHPEGYPSEIGKKKTFHGANPVQRGKCVLFVEIVWCVGSKFMLRCYDPFFFEIGEDLVYPFIDSELIGFDDKLRVLRFLVWGRDAGKIRDLPCPRLFVIAGFRRPISTIRLFPHL